MTDIYLLTSGSYSDYSVEAVFTDKAEAERVAEVLNQSSYESYGVEDFPLVSERMEHVLQLQLNFTDTAAYGWSRPPVERYMEAERIRRIFPWQEESCDFRSHTSAFGFVVEGTDIERVRKVYSERRAEWIAKAEGIA